MLKWNDHSKKISVNPHAFLSPSNYHWLGYDTDKLIQVYANKVAVEKGVELHDFAARCIKLRQRLPKSNKTLNSYINDAIGFKLTPEQVLYYSDNCYGTSDAIGFNNNFLRIHDLKTGKTPASLKQLEVYAALFCLEYKIKPGELNGCELRIYQNNDVLVGNPTPNIILETMDKIVWFDKIIEEYKNKEGIV